jgi:hypothetical protein
VKLFRFVLLAVTAIIYETAAAQNFQMYVVNPGANPSWSIPDSVEYKFPGFMNGYIVTKDDKRTQSMKLNFSHLFVSPVMINTGGDTLLVAPEIIKQLWINKTCYVFVEDKYMELLTFAEPVRLAKQRYLRLFRVEHVDERGGVSPARSSQNLRGTSPVSQNPNLNPNSSVGVNTQKSFKFETEYYFVTKNGDAVKAKSSSILKLHKSNSKAVEAFINEQEIDFDDESDLLRLMDYCQMLPR